MCKLYYKVFELRGQALVLLGSPETAARTHSPMDSLGRGICVTHYRSDPNLISATASLMADKYESEQCKSNKGERWDGLEPACGSGSQGA